MKAIGNGLYDVCPDCGQIVKLNKWLVGSTHLCTLPEERIKYKNEIDRAYRYNRTKLEQS